MTRQRQTKLFIHELEKERNEIECKISFFKERQDNVAFLSLKVYEKQLQTVNRVINTLMLITDKKFARKKVG